LTALILILIFLGTITFVKVYYSTDDCKPIIEQNKLLMEQNTSIVKKNSDLIDGYIKIEGLLGKVTHDTIYITTTQTLRPLERVYTNAMVKSDNDTGVVSDGMVRPMSRTPLPEIKKNIKVKPGNGQVVISQIQKIIDIAKKK